MNKAVLQARKAHRKVIESQYEHTCTIKEFQSVKDPISKVTKKQEATILENQPCRLSYSSVQQIIKLFIAPEIEIKEGSKIIITHEGRTTEFKHSGKPAIYSSHQEIVLELVDNA